MAMAALSATTMQAQQYDTLPYNLQMPQFLTENPLDSMHFLHDGSTLLILPRLQRVAVAQEEIARRAAMDFNSGDYALGFHFDSALTVIGVAWVDWVAFMPRLDSLQRRYDSAEVKLYTPEGNDMIPFASKRIRFDTMVVNRVYAPYKGWGQPDADWWEAYMGSIGNQDTIHCYHLIEVYFDREYNVTDSFYMSVKHWSTYIPFNRVDKDDRTFGWMEWFHNGANYETLGHRFPAQSYMMKSNASSAWQYGEIYCYPLLFPIVRRECDSCPDVQGLRWSRLGSGTTAFVQWDAGVNHRDWQLSYGPTGTPAGEGPVVDCPIAQSVLSGMAAGHPYDIYVRARCRFARDEWTGWSGPLEVGFGSPGEGIDEAAGLHAELTPNPATGRVRVSCGEALRMVEVYDMQGRRCLAQEVQGSETVLDISALAAGQYTVLLHTATATAAKALVVQ